MNKLWIAVTGALLIAAGGCASGGGGKREASRERGGPTASLNQSRMLLSHARELQSEQGCARAIPTYRVVASFGEGYEVAQYELGACLLKTDGANSNDTALFREEGVLWIKRAAWAGNARAQHRLAQLLSGADYEHIKGISPAPQQAMGWALVYSTNPKRELYALPDVAAPVLTHLQSSLSEDEQIAAQNFAASFDEISLAAFTPPAQPQRRSASGQRGGSPDGERRKRRQADTILASKTGK